MSLAWISYKMLQFKAWMERTFGKRTKEQSRQELIAGILRYDKHFVLEDANTGEPYTTENLNSKTTAELIEIKLGYLEALKEDVGE